MFLYYVPYKNINDVLMQFSYIETYIFGDRVEKGHVHNSLSHPVKFHSVGHL